MYTVKLYGERTTRPGNVSVATDVVLQLLAPLLSSGRKLVIDIVYRSITLTQQLNAASTHLIGTLCSKRKCYPSHVISAKLKKGKIKTLQNKS